jgi:hypothetical protein
MRLPVEEALDRMVAVDVTVVERSNVQQLLMRYAW